MQVLIMIFYYINHEAQFYKKTYEYLFRLTLNLTMHDNASFTTLPYLIFMGVLVTREGWGQKFLNNF